MPTVILLDVSLSMCRPASRSTNGRQSETHCDTVDIKQLANVGIGNLLDYFAQNAQLEHAALVVYSSLYEIRSQFTRNHESIKNGIYELELYDKSHVVNALRGILSLKLDEWSQSGTINIVLITDGQIYHNDMLTRNKRARSQHKTAPDDDNFQDISLNNLTGLFDFPCKIQVINLTSPRDPCLKHSLKFYKELITTIDPKSTPCPVLTSGNLRDFKQSAIWLPESSTLDISVQAVENLFTSLAELHYKPYHSVLSFGHLSSMVLLSPKPTESIVAPLKNDFDDLNNETSNKESHMETFVSALNKVSLFKLNEEIYICGFMPTNEIASPAIITRHIILPVANPKYNEISKAEQILTQDSDAYSKSTTPTNSANTKTSRHSSGARSGKHNSTNGGHNGELSTEIDLTKQPSFSVLLHNCLKQENMIAVCSIGKNDETGEDWFGFLHSHLDSRKRASMILSLLTPGSAPVLWLPDFRTMGSVHLNLQLPGAAMLDIKTANRRMVTKSYSSNSVIWLDPESVQADVQKIVRYAKRGPDKAPQFYKELNRIRRAAISYGFFDVLSGIALILEREMRVLAADSSKPTNQEMALHLGHVISKMRADLTPDSYENNILPPYQAPTANNPPQT